MMPKNRRLKWQKSLLKSKTCPRTPTLIFKGDLPAADAKDKTGAQQTAVLISKMIQAAQMMASPIRKH